MRWIGLWVIALLLSPHVVALGKTSVSIEAPQRILVEDATRLHVHVTSHLSSAATLEVLARSPAGGIQVAPASTVVELAPGETRTVTFDLTRSAPGSASEPLEIIVRGESGGRDILVEQTVAVQRAGLSGMAGGEGAPGLLMLGAAVGAGAGAGAGLGVALWWREPWFRAGMTAPLVGLYTRIRKQGALAHPTRRRLYEIICGSPGIHAAGIQAGAGTTPGTTWHHLRVLELHGLVVSRDERGFRKFFPAHHPPTRLDLLSPQQRLVHDAIPPQGITQPDLAARMGVTRQAVNQHIASLRERGLVELRRVGGEWRCYRLQSQ